MNEIAPQDPFRPMLAQSSINAGAVAIESERAIAEARGKIQVAKMFPRSMAQAMADDLFEAVTSGKVKIHIDQRYKLEDVQQAHRDLEARKTTGCTILTL